MLRRDVDKLVSWHYDKKANLRFTRGKELTLKIVYKAAATGYCNLDIDLTRLVTVHVESKNKISLSAREVCWVGWTN